MGQDNKPRYGTFHQFAEIQAYSRAGQHDWLIAHIGKFRQLFIECRNQFLHGIRVDADVGAVLRTLYTARNAVFQGRVQRDAGERPILHILLGDMTGHGMTDILGKYLRILGCPPIIGQHLQNGAHIANGNALPQEIGQYLLNLAHVEQVGNNLVHQGLIGFLEVVDKVLGFLTAEDFICMLLDDLGEMGGENRHRIYYCITI